MREEQLPPERFGEKMVDNGEHFGITWGFEGEVAMTMQPGARLDRIVAERVMKRVGGSVVPYSGDLDAAFEVVKRVGYHLELKGWHGRWEATFDFRWKAEGMSVPLAICRAALLTDAAKVERDG